MILGYVQLLLVCLSFWFSKQAVARARRRQWAMALPFGGIVLLCLLIPKSGWFLLVLVDVALLIVALRLQPPRQCCARHRGERPDFMDTGWALTCFAIVPGVFIARFLGMWPASWLLLMVLAGGVSALFVRDDAMLPTGEPVVDRLVSWIDDCIDDLIDRGQQMLPPLSAADLGLACEWIAFYEWGKDPCPPAERQYNYRFPQQTTRYIMLEVRIGVRKLRRWRDRRCQFVYRYYKPDRSLWVEDRQEVMIKATWKSFSSTWGWGWAEPGQWTPGIYRIEILLEGEKFTSGSFTIDSPPMRSTRGRFVVLGRVGPAGGNVR